MESVLLHTSYVDEGIDLTPFDFMPMLPVVLPPAPPPLAPPSTGRVSTPPPPPPPPPVEQSFIACDPETHNGKWLFEDHGSISPSTLYSPFEEHDDKHATIEEPPMLRPPSLMQHASQVSQDPVINDSVLHPPKLTPAINRVVQDIPAKCFASALMPVIQDASAKRPVGRPLGWR